MRTVGVWVSGLLASAIPFIFIGAVIALMACIFDAVGEHRPVAHRASFQAEAAPSEQVLAIASVHAPDDVAERKDAYRGNRRQHAGRSASHHRVKHTSRFAKHLAKQARGASQPIW